MHCKMKLKNSHISGINKNKNYCFFKKYFYLWRSTSIDGTVLNDSMFIMLIINSGFLSKVKLIYSVACLFFSLSLTIKKENPMNFNRKCVLLWKSFICVSHKFWFVNTMKMKTKSAIQFRKWLYSFFSFNSLNDFLEHPETFLTQLICAMHLFGSTYFSSFIWICRCCCCFFCNIHLLINLVNAILKFDI